MHPCCGLQSSLITRVSPWLSGKDSQSFGCFAFTSIVTREHIWVLWGAAGIHRILRETSKLLAEFFTWDIYLGVIDLITRRLHALVRPSCTWITPEFTRSNHIYLNHRPIPPSSPQLTRGTRKLTNHEPEPQDKKVKGDGHTGPFHS